MPELDIIQALRGTRPRRRNGSRHQQVQRRLKVFGRTALEARAGVALQAADREGGQHRPPDDSDEQLARDQAGEKAGAERGARTFDAGGARLQLRESYPWIPNWVIFPLPVC